MSVHVLEKFYVLLQMSNLAFQIAELIFNVSPRLFSMFVCCYLALTNELLFLWLDTVFESMAKMLALLAECLVTGLASHTFEQPLLNFFQN